MGHQEGGAYLVMELIDGQTLAERLVKGALPLPQALEYAIQIAAALEAAHLRGIVHRDLKPANVMLTKVGVKVLDFGIAKTTTSVASVASTTLTAEGMLVGTLHYIAPEQLEGKEADARSDVFAFGAVLYEMVAGKKAFEGTGQASVIRAILDADPPALSTVSPQVPPLLDHVVKSCLAKEPDDRWQNASDLGRALKWIADGITQASGPATTGVRRSNRLAWSVATAAVLLAVLAISTLGFLRRAPLDTPAYRATILPPASLGGGPSSRFALSPDGRRLAFVAPNEKGRMVLWVRALDSIDAQPLADTDGASSPFWAPDSRFIAFIADGKLKKINSAGGPALSLCDVGGAVAAGWSGTWNRDDVIVFQAGAARGLFRVAAAGGTPSAVTSVDTQAGEYAHWFPSFLPDGRHFLYTATRANGTSGGVYVGSIDSAERTRLLDGVPQAKFAQGHLLFMRQTTLMAQLFDPVRLSFTGEPMPVAQPVLIDARGAGAFAVSDTGVLLYQAGSSSTTSRLVWFDRTGRQIAVLGDPADYADLFLSPDGKHASVSLPAPGATTRDQWIIDTARGWRTHFTTDPGDEFEGAWSADGRRILFNSSRRGHLDLYQKNADGSGGEEVLLADNMNKYPQGWSPDGQFVSYMVVGKTSGQDMWILPLSGDRKPFPLLETPSNDGGGQFSRDGHWMTYWSQGEVWVSSFSSGTGASGAPSGRPTLGPQWQVSIAGGSYPRWRQDGKEIFYRAPDDKLMAAEVNCQGSACDIGEVRALFNVRPASGRWFYDVSPDGQRFLVNTADEKQLALAPITLVVNWTGLLKR